jgi:hypothetical protein
VSSDSDFTRLAQRLREEGLTVYGFGERKTPEAFVAACDKFVYTELLRPARAEAAKPAPAKPAPVKPAPAPRKAGPGKAAPVPAARPAKVAVEPARTTLPLPVDLLQRAIEEASDDSGWATLSAVGDYLTKVQPDFDSRLYGHRKLSDLLRKSAPAFVVEERDRGDGKKAVYVRAG